MSDVVTAVCDALLAQARRELAKLQSEDSARPIGQKRIDIDFYDKTERDKPVEDYDFHAHGHHYQGSGSRWCVVIERWSGKNWKRSRRISGPLRLIDALDRKSEEQGRLTARQAQEK